MLQIKKFDIEVPAEFGDRLYFFFVDQ